MRDLDRIRRILKLIEVIWLKAPDFRLGQLLFGFGGFHEGNIFYIEDDVVEKALEEAIKRISDALV